MHLLVIAAFALVLAAPPGIPPMALVDSPTVTLAIVAGLTVAVWAVVAVGTVATFRRLSNPNPTGTDGLRFFARFQVVWRVGLFAVTVMVVQFTPWMHIVRGDWQLGRIWGVSDLVALSPFFLGVVGAWVIQFPVDRAIRELTTAVQLWDGKPARPVWGIWQYLGFHIRHHLLLIVVPMVGVLVLRDAQRWYGPVLRAWTGQPVAGQLAFLAGVGGVFLFSPFMLRHIWSTVALPPGPLRARLERLCTRVGLGYRQILIWQSEGVMVNAAVMGLIAPLRYILLSDGLLESVEDEKIEAVFGHEAGHVVHHHIPFYLAFAVLSMMIAGGVALLLLLFVHGPPAYWMQLVPIVLVAAMWLLGFGWISRRFERQADLYGARCVTPDAAHCGQACFVHPQLAGDGGAERNPDEAEPVARSDPPPEALCRTAAETFAEALERIAVLNGIAPKARSWRHSSIASRADFLRHLAEHPEAVKRFGNVVVRIKIFLAAGMAIALPLTVYLYFTGRLPPELIGSY